jgi:hypothetical protein
VGDCETQVTNKMQPNLSSEMFLGGHEPMQQMASSSISKGRVPKSELWEGVKPVQQNASQSLKP